MKALRKINSIAISFGLVVIFNTAYAQEYDDMYFNKTDRKTVKTEHLSSKATIANNGNYKDIAESTEAYSAKNINPEYIARYNSSADENQVSNETDGAYNSQDYFVEDYNDDYVSDNNNGNIDYVALNKRDQMSTPYYNRSFSNSTWGFNPYMGMGFGNPYSAFGYDPYMMGYGSGLSMGFGYNSGFGFSPFMSYGMSMSWGSGYSPYGFGGYPGFYNPYRMNGFYNPYRMNGFYDPYGYNSFARYGYPYYGGGYYGGYNSTIIINEANGRNINYTPRTTRSATSVRNNVANTSNQRVSTTNSKLRVPDRTNVSTSNGRVNRDYSKAQNEYYNSQRSSSSSAQRISRTSANSNRNSYSRSVNPSSSYSTINSNRPSRSSNNNSSTIYNRSNSNTNSGFSNSNSNRSSSYSAPRSSGSSYSIGSSSGRSSGSSMGSGSSGSRSSGGSSSRSGGRQ